jgi:hypothetical protein
MRYRLIDAGGRVLDEGEGEASVEDGSLLLPQADLRVAPAAVKEVVETAQPYGLRLAFTDGGTLELTMLGRMRGQLFAELGDARKSDLGIGAPETFTAVVDGVRGELQVYEDCLVTVATERIPFSFIDGVTEADYRVTIAVTGRAALTASALGRRTTEFAKLLDDRGQQARKRTSAFLGALLPDLGPMTLRSLAMILRDGRAGSPEDLDGIDPAIRPALLNAATHPECRTELAQLTTLGPVWIGFAQTTSVRRPAVGVEAWHDSAPAPHLYSHDYTTRGLWSPALAYGMLGFGFGAVPDSRSMTPRADVRHGLLTPAHDDLTALTVTGEAPTIQSFALCQAGDKTVYQVLNRPDQRRREYQSTDIRTVNLQVAQQP